MYGNSARFGSNVSFKMSTDLLCSLNLSSRQIGETKIQTINLIKYRICLKCSRLLNLLSPRVG